MPPLLVARRRESLRDAILRDNPTGYWPLDEAAGTTAFDRSGNGRNGTYNGAPTLSATGPAGLKCVSFVPDAQYVALGTPPVTTSAFSAEAWINPTDFAPAIFYTILSNSVPSWTGWSWSVATGSANKVTFDMGSGPSGGFTSPVDATGFLSTGQWQHVAFTVAGTTATLYRNAVQIASGTTLNQPGSGNPMQISSFNTSFGRSFRGGLALVALFPSTLSPARIRAHYEAGVRIRG